MEPPVSDPAPVYTTENGGQLNIFYTVQEGPAVSLVYAYSAPQAVPQPSGFGSELRVPAGVTTLTTLYVPGSNQWQVFFLSPYLAGVGGIYRLVYDSGDEYPDPQPWIVTDSGNSNIGVGEPATIATPDGQQHIFFNGSNSVLSGVFHIAYDPASPENPYGTNTWDLWTPGGAVNLGQPVPMYTTEGNELNVFYKDGAGGIWKVSRDLETTAPPSMPVQWAPLAQEGSQPAASNPAVICIANADVTVQHVFYVDAEGDIWHVYYDLSAENGVPLLDLNRWGSGAVGNPAILNNSADGQIHLFYRNAAGSIWHVSCAPTTGAVPNSPVEWFSGYMFTGRGGPPGLRGRLWPNRAAGDPFPVYVPFGENGQQHVFFRGHDNGIYDVFRDGDSRYTVKWA
jgi:hypothetical protein